MSINNWNVYKIVICSRNPDEKLGESFRNSNTYLVSGRTDAHAVERLMKYGNISNVNEIFVNKVGGHFILSKTLIYQQITPEEES